MPRVCGDCQLCCKLVPVKELAKGAGVRCQHQKVGKGCTIYANRPFSCRWWDCQWLRDEDPELRRPDHVHYVIDPQLDFVVAVDDATGKRVNVPVIQIWGDERHPNAHRDPALRDWLIRMHAQQGLYAIVRYANARGVMLGPPETPGGPLLEKESTMTEHEHSLAEKLLALGEGLQ